MAEIEKEAEPEKLPTTLELTPALPAVTEKERDMANSAHQNFEKGKYESCVNTLSKLAVSRPHDPKVLHNKAVAEYYLSQSRKTEEFQKSMTEVCTQAHINIENVEALEDVDHCIIFFNQAVILYHLHQYYKAISILDKVFQFIEPLDENLARRVCFLLLELYLCSHQPEKALGLIGYIESMLFGGNKANSNGKGQAGDKEKENEGNKEKEVKESKENKEMDETNYNEIYRPKLQQYKARCYIMLKSAKACKREIKNLMTSGMNIPAIFLRSQLEYLRGNYRKGLKVLNTAFATTPSNSFLETGDNLTAMYYNNVGCVHFYIGKPHLGCFYFNKALEEHNNVVNSAMSSDEKSENTNTSRPIHTMNLTTRYQILYNLGLQYLHAGRPLQAFDCLVEAVQVYHTNPRLWLRIAECCIQVHKPDNSCDFQQAQKRKDIIQGLVGSGPNRKIILSPFLSNDNKVSVQGQSSAIPMATMEFASLCLSNALILLPEDPPPIPVTPITAQNATGDDASEGSQSVEGNSSLLVLPANSIQGTEIASLRNSILAASSYVALCLGDVVMALKHAKVLLDQPKLCGAHRMLGHLYAAEALILMDSISDAVEQLNQDDVKDISLSLPTLTEEMKSGEKEDSIRPTGNLQNWFPNTLSTAKLVMQYNLTVAYTLRGEIDKASELLRLQLSASKSPGVGIPFQAIMLAVYIQLQIGYADVAKNIIKQNSAQFR